MNLLKKVLLYYRTIRYLKKEQLLYQVLVRLGWKCSLNKKLKYNKKVENVLIISGTKELNYDADFIKRFPVDDLMNNKITILHESVNLTVGNPWTFGEKSLLWNHNLHYFEYLFSLAKKYEDTANPIYVDKVKEYILSWIEDNPMGTKNSAWACYPIALRLSNWIDVYSILQKEFVLDENFNSIILNNLYNQYVFLVQHLEKHLMANHYFEDLRSIIIGAVFFKDNDTCEKAVKELENQCSEQVLEDGFQFERSPMYQKILLEDLIKVQNALKIKKEENAYFKTVIKKMLDVSYSLENGISRIPLFNDCGNNITKSLNSLVKSSKNIGVFPSKKNVFSSSGFYIYRFGDGEKCRLIVDAGQPGPSYSPGHAHNEMMSYELFVYGKPAIVNCGTYAYQFEQRAIFKSTSSHNTVRIMGIEQSEFWSNFRLARRATLARIEYDGNALYMEAKDYLNNLITRQIIIENNFITVVDKSEDKEIESFVHCKDSQYVDINIETGKFEIKYCPYAEEFGLQDKVQTYFIKGKGEIRYSIHIKG